MKDVFLYLFGIPGVFIILFLFTIFYLFTDRVRKARTVCVITIVVVYLLSCYTTGEFLASHFLIKNVKFKQLTKTEDIDMIVMPSKGIEYNGKSIGWVPSQDSFKAGLISYDIQSRLVDKKVPVLICGGQISSNKESDSNIIKTYFSRQHAQIKKTIVEDVSKDLYEQVWQCVNIIKHYNAKNPVLVVDEVNMLRTLALFRERGIEMTPIPVFSLDTGRSWSDKYLPSLEGVILNKKVINEISVILYDLLTEKIKTNQLSYSGEK